MNQRAQPLASPEAKKAWCARGDASFKIAFFCLYIWIRVVNTSRCLQYYSAFSRVYLSSPLEFISKDSLCSLFAAVCLIITFSQWQTIYTAHKLQRSHPQPGDITVFTGKSHYGVKVSIKFRPCGHMESVSCRDGEMAQAATISYKWMKELEVYGALS